MSPAERVTNSRQWLPWQSLGTCTLGFGALLVALACAKHVEAADLTWNNVSTQRSWNTTSLYWDHDNNLLTPNVAYQNGDNVTFGEIGFGSVTLASNHSPSSVTVDSSQNYTFTGQGIGGSGSLTKLGSGALVLNNANTYTGATIISDGILRLSRANALPTATNVTLSATLDLGGFDHTIAGLSGSGAVINASGIRMLTISSSGDSLFEGTIGATGARIALNKSGTGVFSLSGLATSLAATTHRIVGGVLRLLSDERIHDAGSLRIDALGTLDLAGVTETLLSITGAGKITNTHLTDAATLKLAGGVESDLLGVIEGQINLELDNAGLVKLAGENTFVGQINVRSTNLTLASNSALGAAGNVIFLDEAAVSASGLLASHQNWRVVAGANSFDVASGGNYTIWNGLDIASGAEFRKTGLGVLDIRGQIGLSGSLIVESGTLIVDYIGSRPPTPETAAAPNEYTAPTPIAQAVATPEPSSLTLIFAAAIMGLSAWLRQNSTGRRLRPDQVI